LRFALELKRDLGSVNDDISRLPETTIDRSVTIHNFGGTNVIASQDVTQINRKRPTKYRVAEFAAVVI
jgi:hypothetical protein